jgi:hypothetical protein
MLFHHLPISSLGWRWPRLLTALALIATALTVARSAYAASITVTSTADVIDAAASCASVTVASLPGPNGLTSLREAICAANANSDADTITLPAGTFVFTRTGNDDNASLGDLDITQSVTINGAGAGSTIIDGQNADRIFDIAPISICNCAVNFSGLTLRNGSASSSNFSVGGAMYINQGTTVTISNSILSNNQSVTSTGGAIENRGSLTLTNVTMQNNTAKALGGAINSIRSLTVTNSTFTNNQAEAGGALYINTDSTFSATITGSTFTNNHTVATASGVTDDGAAIAADTDGSVSITMSTFTGNGAANNGGALYFNDSNTQAAVGTMTANFNRIVGNTAATGSGLYRASGTVNAINNWWGCNAGPTASPCDLVAGTATFNPWLFLRLSASPTTINTGGTSTLTANFLTNSASQAISAANLTALVGVTATFGGTLGTVSPTTTSIGSNGQATSTFTAGSTPGSGAGSVTVDSQPAINASIMINAAPTATPTNTPTNTPTATPTSTGGPPTNTPTATPELYVYLPFTVRP